MDILLRRAKIYPSDAVRDVGVEDGRIVEVSERISEEAEREVDCAGRMVFPSFSDMHIHLDTALTLGRPRFNLEGTLLEGIRIWGEYKKSLLGKDELKARARRVVEWLVSFGVTRIRTHADVSQPQLTSLRGLLELKNEVRDAADIEVTAFPQDGVFTDKENAELLEKALEMGADNVGLIPHNEFTREDGVESVRYAFQLAKKYGRKVDGHIDETDDDHSRFLEVVAAETIRNGMQGKVAAGHTTAMHSYNNAYAYKLLGLLAKAGVTIVVNPPVNLNLQGRFDTYPKRRGVTRVKELVNGGVNVALGQDDIMDPWYPLGNGDCLKALYMGVHAAHMLGAEELKRSFDLVTFNAAKALGIEDSYGIQVGSRADFVVVDAYDELETLRNQPSRLLVVKEGRIVAETSPSKSYVYFNGQKSGVDTR
jgi:cytosine deaminase